MTKLIVELPQTLHQAIKKHALGRGETIREFVTRLIEQALILPKAPDTQTPTGCCGIWQDDRSAEEIIQEIQRDRRWFTTRP